jgi:hypothetical protein
MSIASLMENGLKQGLLSKEQHQQVRDWMRVRNGVVHSQETVTRNKATDIVNGALQLMAAIRSAGARDD